MSVLEQIIADFPDNLIDEADLFLILMECIPNASNHGTVKRLDQICRKRKQVMLMSFNHDPALDNVIDKYPHKARNGWLPDLLNDPLGGLGFPILFRIVRKITVSFDSKNLHLWLRFCVST